MNAIEGSLCKSGLINTKQRILLLVTHVSLLISSTVCLHWCHYITTSVMCGVTSAAGVTLWCHYITTRVMCGVTSAAGVTLWCHYITTRVMCGVTSAAGVTLWCQPK